MENTAKQYIVVSFLKPPAEIFVQSTWPLHVTIVRPFSSMDSLVELSKKIKEVCALHTPLVVLGESRELIGPDKNVPVTKLAENSHLTKLHEEIEEACGNPLEFIGPTYNFYLPHVTDYAGESIQVGDEVTLSSVSIVEKQGSEWRVLQTIDLGK